MAKPKIPQREFIDRYFIRKTLLDGSKDPNYMIRDMAVDFAWRVFLRDNHDIETNDFMSLVGFTNTSRMFENDSFLGKKDGRFWIGWDLNKDCLPERCKGIATLKSEHP